jgi:hypothetical protein
MIEDGHLDERHDDGPADDFVRLPTVGVSL